MAKKEKLLKAIENGELDEVSSLLEGFNELNETFSKPDNEDVENWTYLLHACKFGNSGLFELLLKSGADSDVTDSDDKLPLYWASCNDEDDEAAMICTVLIEKGVEINHQATNGQTALMRAAMGKNKTLKVLLDAGADSDLQDVNGVSALMYAATTNNSKSLKVLLEAGVDPNLQNADGVSALYLAASKSVEAVQMLLEHNADPNIETCVKTTPIFEAADASNIEIMSVLIEGGADINQKAVGNDGEPLYPLDVAVGDGDATGPKKAAANFLFSQGAKHSDSTTIELTIDVDEF